MEQRRPNLADYFTAPTHGRAGDFFYVPGERVHRTRWLGCASSGEDQFLLQESGDFLLQESTDFILLEASN